MDGVFCGKSETVGGGILIHKNGFKKTLIGDLKVSEKSRGLGRGLKKASPNGATDIKRGARCTLTS